MSGPSLDYYNQTDFGDPTVLGSTSYTDASGEQPAPPGNPIDITTLTDATPAVFSDPNYTPGYQTAISDTAGMSLNENSMPSLVDVPGMGGSIPLGGGAGQTSQQKNSGINIKLPGVSISTPQNPTYTSRIGSPTVRASTPHPIPGQTNYPLTGAGVSGIGGNFAVIALILGAAVVLYFVKKG